MSNTGELESAKESRISSILISLDGLSNCVGNLINKIDYLVGQEPSDSDSAENIELTTLKDLLDHLPAWLEDIRINIEQNTRL